MADSPVKNVRAENSDSTTWSKMRRFSFRKSDLHLEHWNPGPNWPILRDIWGRNILPVKTAIKRSITFNHHNHENGSTIDVFLIFLVQT